MSRSLNKVMLIGNVGGDPDIRSTQGGTRVAKLSLATNRSWTGRDGVRQEKTEWHRLTFFGRTAEIVEEWVTKGKRLYVEGRLEYSQSQNERGEVRYWTDIVVENMMMLDSGGGGGENRGAGRSGGFQDQRRNGGAGPAGGESDGGGTTDPDDDLPF